MPEKSKNLKILLIIGLIIILGAIILIVYNPYTTTKEAEVYAPIPEASMEVGSVGFLEEGKTIEEVNPEAIENPVRPIDLPVPNHIFNTAGTILDIGENFITIRGNGSNFDDQAKRDLTIVVDENTKINKASGVKPADLLNIGDIVFVESPYNIHGKTSFTVSYINIQE